MDRERPTSALMVVLARSYKHQGLCIAGKQFTDNSFGRWIRPVGDTPAGELTYQQCESASGTGVALLDIVEVPLLGAAPELHQSENHRVDSSPWIVAGRAAQGHLPHLVDSEATLWKDVAPLDRVPGSLIDRVGHSLELIEVSSVIYAKNQWGRWRARFTFDGDHFDLSLTDEAARQQLATGPSTQEAGRSYLTVSLGENYNGAHYKLVAGVIDRELVGNL